MKKALHVTAWLLFAFSAQLMAQDSPIFPKGKVATVDNHTGTVWLSELSKSDEVFDFNVAHATFAPGAKLDWHIHPGGQILMITEGTGYYQEKGKPIQVVHKGDVIKCAPALRIGTERHQKVRLPTSRFRPRKKARPNGCRG